MSFESFREFIASIEPSVLPAPRSPDSVGNEGQSMTPVQGRDEPPSEPAAHDLQDLLTLFDRPVPEGEDEFRNALWRALGYLLRNAELPTTTPEQSMPAVTLKNGTVKRELAMHILPQYPKCGVLQGKRRKSNTPGYICLQEEIETKSEICRNASYEVKTLAPTLRTLRMELKVYLFRAVANAYPSGDILNALFQKALGVEVPATATSVDESHWMLRWRQRSLPSEVRQQCARQMAVFCAMALTDSFFELFKSISIYDPATASMNNLGVSAQHATIRAELSSKITSNLTVFACTLLISVLRGTYVSKKKVSYTEMAEVAEMMAELLPREINPNFPHLSNSAFRDSKAFYEGAAKGLKVTRERGHTDNAGLDSSSPTPRDADSNYQEQEEPDVSTSESLELTGSTAEI